MSLPFLHEEKNIMGDFEMALVRALAQANAGVDKAENDLEDYRSNLKRDLDDGRLESIEYYNSIETEPEPELNKSNLEWWFKNSYTFLDIDALTRVELDDLVKQAIKIIQSCGEGLIAISDIVESDEYFSIGRHDDKSRVGVIPKDNEESRLLQIALTFINTYHNDFKCFMEEVNGVVIYRY